MDLYCQCGNPILVAAHWDGDDYHLTLHDSALGRYSDAITRCPRCGRDITLDDLSQFRPFAALWSSAESAASWDRAS